MRWWSRSKQDVPPPPDVATAGRAGHVAELRARLDPRWGRLITALQQFAIELGETPASVVEAHRAEGSRRTAGKLLDLAIEAAARRRLDDSWSLLHSAKRRMLDTRSTGELQILSLPLIQECTSKLTGWRGETAAAALEQSRAITTRDRDALPDTPTASEHDRDDDPARRRLLRGITTAQEMLDENSQNTYLRMRLLARRLIITTTALVVALGGLLWVCPHVPIENLPRTLTSRSLFIQAVLLGALGALLSFAIGSIRRGVDYRIYELASGNLATTLARILVGSTSAVVAISATQLNVLPLRIEWSALVGVAAGFSERLVRHVIESLSESAEKPAPSKPTGNSGDRT